MLKRLMNVIKGFFGLFVSGVERKNPEALLELEKENLRKQIAQYNQSLASHAGLCENLMSQVKRLETEESDLRGKAAANLRAGNQARAGEYAMRLQEVRRNLEENRAQLSGAEDTYNELKVARDVSVKAARDKIESLRRDLDDMKIKKAQAELSEMAGGMVNSIGSSGDTLNRLHEMVREERDKAAGRARVARDSLDVTNVRMQESEAKALEMQALADFAAAEGLSIPGVPEVPSTPPPTRSMTGEAEQASEQV
jgi:phage shock protein A